MFYQSGSICCYFEYKSINGSKVEIGQKRPNGNALKLLHLVKKHLTKEQFLEKLNKCIVNPISYKFNTEAFILSSGNLKHKQIVKLFELINVSLNDALKKIKH